MRAAPLALAWEGIENPSRVHAVVPGEPRALCGKRVPPYVYWITGDVAQVYGICRRCRELAA